MKQRHFRTTGLICRLGYVLGGSILLWTVGCSSDEPDDADGNVTTPPADSSAPATGGTAGSGPGDSSASTPPTGGTAGSEPSAPPGAGAAPGVPPATSTSTDTTSGTPPASTDPNTDTGDTASETSSTDPGSSTGSGEDSTTASPTTDTPTEDPNADANPSGWPEPGEGGAARPSGTAGNLQVLDWAGFKAAITYSLDDCTPSQVALIDDLMALDVPLTFYIQTNQGSACDTIANKALEAGGHELGNHTHSHQQDAATAGADTDQATQYIEDKYGVTPLTMAAPFGDASVYSPVAQQRFFINRGVGGGMIQPLDNSDRFNLKGPTPPANADASAMVKYVDDARDAGAWQVLTLHGFTDHSDWAYNPFPLASLQASVEHAKQQGDVWIGTVADIGAYWWGQKLLSDATPESSGDEQVWTWTLPDHFPPGRYLRVTVDGGALSQDGQALPWNDHGYYEVALDVGSLTLSP